MKKKRVFVTGGAGFIGSHLVELLTDKFEVTVFDKMISSVVDRKWLEERNVTLIKGDITNLPEITKAMKRHDAVIAMAAAHLRLSLVDPLTVHHVNATGTLSTLLAAKKNNIKRVVYISSSESYGSAVTKTMKEDHLANPTTVYGMSKYIGELYTNEFGLHEGLSTTVIRPFNTYGPRSHFDGYYGEVIPRMVIRTLHGLPPIIFGIGDQTRDFTYVTDTAQGIADVLENEKTIGKTINIAFGKEVSINDIAHSICRGINPTIQPIYKSVRPNDVARHAADTTYAQKLIGWKPKVTLEDGIKMYIAWVKKTYKDPKKLLKKVPEKNW